jgi:isopentenyl-diphosphate delta-isomerase
MARKPVEVTVSQSETERRKDQHLRICLEEDVDFVGVTTGFEVYRFDHDALPEVNKAELQLDCTLLGKRLSAPLIIGAMTGGSTKAGQVNRILAEAAERTNVGFALGSQRAMLEDRNTGDSFDVRSVAPSVLLFGNIGAVQLNYGVSGEMLVELVKRTGVDALNFHLNPLQEAIQPEGDTNFRGVIGRLREVIPQIPVPCLLKEVGAGISATTAQKIASLPVAGVEVAGVGGTSWAKIEAFRSGDRIQKETGMQLASWGIPTAESLVTCRRLLPGMTLVCSGGMRTGLELAKALSLGADAVAMAIPFLRAAQEGVDAVVQRIEQVKEELRTVMFVTGCGKIEDLRTRAVLRRMR